MRNITITTAAVTIGISYPDPVLYLGDNNFVTVVVSRPQTDISVEVGGYSVGYSASTRNVTLELTTMLRRAGLTGSQTFTVTVAGRTFTFTSYVAQGRTDFDRYHASGRKIIIPPSSMGVTTFELLIVQPSTVTVGTSSQIFSSEGIYTFTVPSRRADTVVVRPLNTVEDVAPHGDFFAPDETESVYYDVEVATCLDADIAVVRWVDHDGCKRYLVGKVMSRSQSVERVEFATGLTVPRNAVGMVTKKVQRLLTIGVARASKSLHLEELTDSEEVVMLSPNGETIALIPAFTSADVNFEKEEDVELQFITQS